MRYRFQSSPNEAGLSLPVLRDVPDGPIVWIEGRNGIGKTLSVRLLDLATGGVPYAGDPEAWKSLAAGTGTISITAQEEDLELSFELDPSHWDTDPLKQEWHQLGTARINGKTTSQVSEVRSLLRVVRIAGEEGLARTVGSQFSELASRMGQFAERVAPSSDEADSILSRLLTLLDSASPEKTAIAEAALKESIARLRNAEDDLKPVANRMALIDRAIRASDSLEALSAQGPGLTREIEELGMKLSDAHERRERALVDLTNAASGPSGSEANEQLIRIERLIGRRERAADTAAREVVEGAAIAGVAPNSQAIADALSAIAAEMESLMARRSDLARSDAVRTFLTDLLDLLDRSTSLDDRSIIIEIAGHTVTSEALARAARTRRTLLDQTDVAQQVDATDSRLGELIANREAVTELAEATSKLTHKREMVREALASLGELEADLEDAQSVFAEARERFDAAVADAERLTIAKQEAERALAVLAQGATERELRDQIDAVGEQPDRLASLRDELHERETGLRHERDEAQRVVDAAQQTKAAAQEESEQSREALMNDPEWRWLRSRQLLPLDWDASRLEAVRRAVAESKEIVSAAANAPRAIETALKDLAAHVADGLPLRPASPLGDAVITVCEERVRAEFMNPAIRTALFDDAEVEAVDLRNPSIAWDKGGLRVIRPFSAFSSGEQAFAYARARIEQVSRVADEHLLLVLDEFSAFIAGDRRRLLNRVLAERIKAGAVSQVLLIVPLSQDYERAAADAGADVTPDLAKRARQVARFGYFTEVVHV